MLIKLYFLHLPRSTFVVSRKSPIQCPAFLWWEDLGIKSLGNSNHWFPTHGPGDPGKCSARSSAPSSGGCASPQTIREGRGGTATAAGGTDVGLLHPLLGPRAQLLREVIPRQITREGAEQLATNAAPHKFSL